jgi:predicted helicase
MAEFKDLIKSINIDGNDGKAFEVLCKWFLKTDPYWKTQVDQVWLWDEWPERLQKTDLGIDLVFKHKNGELWSVQAKCFAETTAVTKAHMDSLLAIIITPITPLRRLLKVISFQRGVGCLFCLHGTQLRVLTRASRKSIQRCKSCCITYVKHGLIKGLRDP